MVERYIRDFGTNQAFCKIYAESPESARLELKLNKSKDKEVSVTIPLRDFEAQVQSALTAASESI